VVTVRVVDPATEPNVARIVVEPAPAPVASPVVLIVATPLADELQATDVVRFWVVPSLKVPVAVNCCVVPATIDGLAGVTASDVSVGLPGGTTVTVVVAVAPKVAVRVTVWFVVTDPAVGANVVDVVVAGTITEGGAGSAAGLFEDSVTVLPPAGAA
jgi:hypothetical protein